MINEQIKKASAYKILFIIALIVFIADQISKAWIFHRLPLDSYFYPDSIEIIKDFFYIVHIGNEGAAWGMFSGYGSLLALFAIVALIGIYFFRKTLELHRPIMQFIFGLLVGGILGNMIDRMIHGHVIDFLDFHFPFSIPYIMPDGRYPSFNVADSAIVVGVGLYMIMSFRSPDPTAQMDKGE